MLPPNHLDINSFDFDIKEVQSCGFVGVDTRTFIGEDNEFTK
jgi:hypothetical protein